jgi:hypothetical protein
MYNRNNRIQAHSIIINVQLKHILLKLERFDCIHRLIVVVASFPTQFDLLDTRVYKITFKKGFVLKSKLYNDYRIRQNSLVVCMPIVKLVCHFRVRIRHMSHL